MSDIIDLEPRTALAPVPTPTAMVVAPPKPALVKYKPPRKPWPPFGYELIRLMLATAVLLTAFVLAVVTAAAPLPMAAALAAIVWRARQRPRTYTACGTAAWCSPEEMQRKGVLDSPTGFGVGVVFPPKPSVTQAVTGLFTRPPEQACVQFRNAFKRDPKPKRIRFPRSINWCVVAPVGVGKSTKLVYPFLHECGEAAVILDVKGEIYHHTAAHRKWTFGHTIVVLDPFLLVTQTPDTFNPLDGIGGVNDPYAIDDCRDLAQALIPDPDNAGNNKHWYDSARNVFTTICAAACVLPRDHPARNIQSVCEAIANAQDFDRTLDRIANIPAWDGILARKVGQLRSVPEKEKATILSVLNTSLGFLNTVMVKRSTTHSSFRPSDICTGKVTVYMIIPPERLAANAGLLKMWITAFLRAIVRNGTQERDKVHLVLDEASSLERFDLLEQAVDKYRGYGLRLYFFYQTLGQLKTCWRDGRDQALLANCSQVYFGTQDYDTAQHISNVAGKQTIIVASGGTNTGTSNTANKSDGGGSVGTSGGTSSGWQQQGRELLTPSEVLQLPQEYAITFTPGFAPVLSVLVPHHAGDPAAVTRGERVRDTLWLWATSLILVVAAGLLAYEIATSPPRATPKNPPQFFRR